MHKAAGDTACELMTSPAITTFPTATVAAAAREMDTTGVKRLPVVEPDGHLIGIVSRRDLVRLYTRSDDDLRSAIVEGTIPSPWIDVATVHPLSARAS
jgi:CBS domain-containing protein